MLDEFMILAYGAGIPKVLSGASQTQSSGIHHLFYIYPYNIPREYMLQIRKRKEREEEEEEEAAVNSILTYQYELLVYQSHPSRP